MDKKLCKLRHLFIPNLNLVKISSNTKNMNNDSPCLSNEQ